MARKSRKNIPVPDTATAKMTKALRTAFYIRLSVEDNQGRGNSIDNQQLVLRDHIADRPEFLLTQTYIDNGLTGTNFNPSRKTEFIVQYLRWLVWKHLIALGAVSGIFGREPVFPRKQLLP